MKSSLIKTFIALAGIALLLAVAHLARLNRAKQTVTQSITASPAPLTNIGSTRTLSILPRLKQPPTRAKACSASLACRTWCAPTTL